jgi:pre-mRNA-splicing factor ATP-dependent RNA helicase DHX16
LEKEDQRTKKLQAASEGGLSVEEIKELATKGTLASKKSKDVKSAIDMFREISRQEYLTKREEKELKLLEQSVRDEEYLFEGVPLTAEEQRQLDINKQILKMAKDKYRFKYKEDGKQFFVCVRLQLLLSDKIR